MLEKKCLIVWAKAARLLPINQCLCALSAVLDVRLGNHHSSALWSLHACVCNRYVPALYSLSLPPPPVPVFPLPLVEQATFPASQAWTDPLHGVLVRSLAYFYRYRQASVSTGARFQTFPGTPETVDSGYLFKDFFWGGGDISSFAAARLKNVFLSFR